MKAFYYGTSTFWNKRGVNFGRDTLKNQGVDLLIIPRSPSKEIFYKKFKGLLENAI
jgi:hypothetical protein